MIVGSLPLRHPLSSSSSYPIPPLPIASSSIIVTPRRAVARRAVACRPVARRAVAIVVVARLTVPTRERPDPETSRAKQAPLPPLPAPPPESAQRDPTPRRCPPLPAPPPASACRSPPCRRHRRLARSASRCVSGPNPRRYPPCRRRRRRARNTSRHVSSPAQTQAEQSDAAAPPLPAPPPPEHLGFCALPFFVWKMGRGGKLFGEAGGWYVFFIMELIRLYVCSVKRLSCFSQNKCTILNS